MKIGFPSHPRKNLIKEIEWIGRNGFDFVDLFLEEDCATPQKIDVEKIKKVLEKYNLSAVGHTAWYLPIGSPVKSLREATVKETVKYFKIFSKLSVKYVTIHASWLPSDLFSPKESINFQISTLQKLVKEAKKYHLNLMYESIDTAKDTIENVSTILKAVPKLFFHLDTGHTNLFKRKPEKFVEKFYTKLRHVHMHDNFGESDLHLPLGKGSISWKKFIPILKKYYDGTITLEIFSGSKNDVLSSKEKLKNLWSKSKP